MASDRVKLLSRSDSNSSDTEYLRYFQNSNRNKLKDDYKVDDQLGDGAFSVVHRAVRISDDFGVAVKIIKKKKVSVADLDREIDIWRLASGSSSRVVQLYDIYEDPRHVYLVMELCTGGELFEKIVSMKDYNENYAAKIMKQVFLIIRDLHKVDIIHQDLKPENLLLMAKDSIILKLCDFGLAEIADDDIELFGCVGSTTYMAPEVTNETGHHKPVDMYAAGVIMYIMLCGYPPFEPENNIIELEFPDREWEDISDAAKHLITKLLDKNPEHRGTPEEVLKDKWFIDVETIKPMALTRTVNTLKKYQEIGPNGTMKEYRGDTKRNTVIGLFDVNGDQEPKQELKTERISKADKLEKSEKSDKSDKKNKKPSKKGSVQKISDKDGLSPRKKGGKKHGNTISSLPLTESQSATKSGKKDKKKKRGQRASASVAELLKVTGQVDFDPKNKGAFEATKKNWAEDLELDIEQIKKFKQQLEQYDVGTRKKERKSEKKTPKSPKRTPNLTDKEESPRIGNGYSALEDLIASFHKELRYQREALEHIKSTVTSLRSQISDEAEQTQVLTTKLQNEISSIRLEAAEDQQEQKLFQQSLENFIQNGGGASRFSKHDKEHGGHSHDTLPKHEKITQSTQGGPSNHKKKRPTTKGHDKK